MQQCEAGLLWTWEEGGTTHPHHGIEQQAVVELDGVLPHLEVAHDLVHHLHASFILPLYLQWQICKASPSRCLAWLLSYQLQ